MNNADQQKIESRFFFSSFLPEKLLGFGMVRVTGGALGQEEHALARVEGNSPRLIKVNCQLRANLKRRLDMYAAEEGLKLQDVFDTALDTYLTQRGH